MMRKKEPAVYQDPMAQTNGSPIEDVDTVDSVENDPVNHPSHYTAGKIEVIVFLEDQGFPFHLANAVKYICRAGKKDPAKTEEDLRKAIWYISRYIEFLKKKREAGRP